LNSGNSPELDIARGIGALGMNDRDIWIHCPDGQDRFAGERTWNGIHCGRVFQEIRIRASPKNSKWQTRSSGHKCGSQTGMRVLFDLEGPGPSVFDSISESMQQSQAGIPAQEKTRFPGTTHADHLIVNDIGCEPDKGEIAPLLPDDFVSGSKRNEMTETLEREGIPVVNEFVDGLFRVVTVPTDGGVSKLSSKITRWDNPKNVLTVANLKPAAYVQSPLRACHPGGAMCHSMVESAPFPKKPGGESIDVPPDSDATQRARQFARQRNSFERRNAMGGLVQWNRSDPFRNWKRLDREFNRIFGRQQPLSHEGGVRR